MCKEDSCEYLYDNLETHVIKANGLYESECWVWQGKAYEYGIYHCSKNNKTLFVHRVACNMFNSPIPRGYVVDHLCEMKLCVNPAHLEAVDPYDNVARARANKKLREERGEDKYDLTPLGTLVKREKRKPKQPKLTLANGEMSVIRQPGGYRFTRAKTLVSSEAVELSKWILESENIDWIDSI